MRYYNNWANNAPDIQPQSKRDIQISRCEIGVRKISNEGEERLISEAIIYYAQNLTMLTLTAVIDLAKTMVNCTQCTTNDRLQISRGWLDGFLKRNSSLKVVSYKRLILLKQTPSHQKLYWNTLSVSKLNVIDII